uniref:Uncharacterized protein n=1 Tax=Arundo donax TaxID=35708 RepID=A0A0A9FVK4_ARUDO
MTSWRRRRWVARARRRGRFPFGSGALGLSRTRPGSVGPSHANTVGSEPDQIFGFPNLQQRSRSLLSSSRPHNAEQEQRERGERQWRAPAATRSSRRPRLFPLVSSRATEPPLSVKPAGRVKCDPRSGVARKTKVQRNAQTSPPIRARLKSILLQDENVWLAFVL